MHLMLDIYKYIFNVVQLVTQLQTLHTHTQEAAFHKVNNYTHLPTIYVTVYSNKGKTSTLSNSSIRQTPLSAKTRAPASSVHSLVTGCLCTYAVKPTAEAPWPVVYTTYNTVVKGNEWTTSQLNNKECISVIWRGLISLVSISSINSLKTTKNSPSLQLHSQSTGGC